MDRSPLFSEGITDPAAPSEPAAGAAPENERLAELEKALEVHKELLENLKEVIQARDLEIHYLQNAIRVKDHLLQHYPNDRVFNSLYVLYLNGNRLLPPGTRRRRLAGWVLSLFVR
jgi:hypothetical protein